MSQFVILRRASATTWEPLHHTAIQYEDADAAHGHAQGFAVKYPHKEFAVAKIEATYKATLSVSPTPPPDRPVKLEAVRRAK